MLKNYKFLHPTQAGLFRARCEKRRPLARGERPVGTDDAATAAETYKLLEQRLERYRQSSIAQAI